MVPHKSKPRLFLDLMSPTSRPGSVHSHRSKPRTKRPFIADIANPLHQCHRHDLQQILRLDRTRLVGDQNRSHPSPMRCPDTAQSRLIPSNG